MLSHNRSKIALTAFKWLLLVAFSIPYLVVTWQLSSPVPYLDDYDALLNFLISVENENSWIKKVECLFKQHNEHRIVVPRLIVWVQYIITGELNLKITILIGNIFLVMSVFIFNQYFLNKKLWYVPVISLILLMNYIHFENYQWALSGLQNYGVLLFALCSNMCFQKKKYEGLLLFSLLTAMCGGIGVLILVVNSIYFLRIKKYFQSILYAVLLIVFYFIFYGAGYKSTHHHPGLLNTLYRLPDLFGYYFILIASYTAPFFRSNSSYAMLLGILILLLNVIATIKGILKYEQIPLLYFSLFLNITLISIALARYPFGFDQAFASRYVVFSTLYLLVTFVLFFRSLNISSEVHWVIGVLFFLFVIYHNYSSKRVYKMYVLGVREHLHNTVCIYKKEGKADLPYIGQENPNEIMKTAEKLKIINLSRVKCD